MSTSDSLKTLHAACTAAIVKARGSELADPKEFQDLAEQGRQVIQRMLTSSDRSSRTQVEGMLGLQDLKYAQVVLGAIVSWGLVPSLPPALHSIGGQSSSYVLSKDQGSPSMGSLDQLGRYTRFLTVFLIKEIGEGSGLGGLGTILLQQHLTRLYAALLVLEHKEDQYPDSVGSGDQPTFSQLLEKCFHTCPLPDSMASFAHLSQNPDSPEWLRRTCGHWMSRVILTPGGISAFLIISLADDAQLSGERVGQLAKTLSTPPKQASSSEAYYDTILPQLISPLCNPRAPAHVVDLCAAILKAFSSPSLSPTTLHSLRMRKISHHLFSFLPSEMTMSQRNGMFSDPGKAQFPLHLRIRGLRAFLDRGGPTDSTLVDPIFLPHLPDLWHIWTRVAECGVGAPLSKDLPALLLQIPHHTSPSTMVSALIDIIVRRADLAHQESWVWTYHVEKGLFLETRSSPSKVKQPEKEEHEFGMEQLIHLLQGQDGKPIRGELFTTLLSEYMSAKTIRELPPAQMLNLLHAILGLMGALGGPELMDNPDQILLFIYRVLESSTAMRQEDREARERRKSIQFKDPNQNKSSSSPTRNPLWDEEALGEKSQKSPFNILHPPQPTFPKVQQTRKGKAMVEREEEEEEGEDEILTLALTLLSTLLQEYDEKRISLDKASQRFIPLITTSLSELHSELEAISTSTGRIDDAMEGDELRGLTASLLLSLRAMSMSLNSPSEKTLLTEEEDKEKTRWEEAMKALQADSIPDRAYGLGILKSIILTKSQRLAADKQERHRLVLLLMTLIHDEDSFVYLQAVRTLAAMTDVYGDEVIRQLGKVYEDPTKAMDARLRVGEAMMQTAERAGHTLGVHIDALIQPLLYVLEFKEQSAHLEVTSTMKASAFGILSMAIGTFPLAMGRYMNQLIRISKTCLEIERVIPVRRAAAFFLVELIRSSEIEGVPWAVEGMREAWRCLRRVETRSEEDPIVQGHAHVGTQLADHALRTYLQGTSSLPSSSYTTPMITELSDD